MGQQIKTIESIKKDSFEKEVNQYLREGWRVVSSSCGFIDSEEYAFASVWQVILVKEEE